MKIVIFGPDKKVGLLSGDRILDIHFAATISGKKLRLPTSSFEALLPVIDAGEAALEAISNLEAEARGREQAGLWHDASDVRLYAPWPGRRLLMAGANHPGHTASLFTNFGQAMSEEDARVRARRSEPVGFWAVSEPIGPGDAVPIPSRANGLFDFEVEPAIVIGRKAKRIRAGDLQSYVWGVTVVADWSVREEAWPMKAASPFALHKNFDASKSIGPCILVGDVDPQSLDMTAHVNGSLRQSYNSSEMTFSFGEILECVSRDLTFHAGDIVSGGTGPGTAMDQTRPEDFANWPRDLFLEPDDVVTMGSTQIGSFETYITQEI